MAMITQKKGKRQILLVIVLIILAVIVGVYLYSIRQPKSAPVSETQTPELAAIAEVTPEEAKPEAKILKTTFNIKVLEKLGELDLVLHGKLPIEVDPKEVGRANPFIAP